MAVVGCTNPGAVNYNGSADTENFSCKYLFKANDQCHLFTDVQPVDIVDRSFTLSYSAKDQSWVYHHDYAPDMYLHIREQLYTAHNNAIYKHNDGPAGVYYSTTPKSFFIDVVFTAEQDILLECVLWVSEFLNTNSTDSRFITLSHISIWNSTQHSGRVPVSQIWNSLGYDNARRTKGEWVFDDFRDALKENAGDFLTNIFNNFSVDPTKIDPTGTWYSNGLIEDKWITVRFEFDNSVSGKLVLHDTAAQVIKTNR